MMVRENTTWQQWNLGFDQGLMAGELGKTASDCPFAPETEGAEGWIMGFEEALAAKETDTVYRKMFAICAGGLIAFTFVGPPAGELKHRLFEDGWLTGLSEGMELATVEYAA